jgi:two-component system osmolarity sensor histidine kinase EnvZ
MFSWIKQYMPKRLYWRAALILILPVVLIQLLVSFVFIQRHFEGVTEQLTRGLTQELGYFETLIRSGDIEGAQKFADSVGISLSVNPDGAFQPTRRFYDLTGIVVIRELSRVASLRGVDLPDNSIVVLRMAIPGYEELELTFARRRVSASNPHQLIVNMVFFGGIFTIIAFFYLRNQLRPITRLAAAAQAFGRGQNVAYSPSGAIEVRAAGDAFLNMRSRIERHIEQRTLILSGVSHDLRTPLTRLKLGLSMLDDREREPLEQDVEDMRTLLDEFLVYAKSLGEDGSRNERVNAITFLDGLVQDYARMGQVVELQIETEETVVMMRENMVKRALENLLNNAFRYGDRVRICLDSNDAFMTFRVEDNGPGIPPDQRENAIKPFARLDPARNQNKGSSVGLGLPIANDIARAHGGHLILSDSDSGGLRIDMRIAK